MRTFLKIALPVGIVAAAVAAVIWFSMPEGDDGPPQPPETYTDAVSAFFAGVAALDADANQRAQSELTRATQLAPEEPSAWLNLALAEIRLGNYEAAEAALSRARALAPEWATPDALSGLLESRRGRPAEAIAYFRSAVEKNPDDIRTLFALAEELERLGQDADQAEVQRLISQILEHRPDNMAMLMEQARLAVKAGDADTLRNVVTRLQPLAQAWPERTRNLYEQVREAAETGDMRQAVSRVTFLRNVLIAEPAFQANLAEVRLPVGVVGVPVQQFRQLPNPAPTPSAPDADLSFAVEPLSPDATRVAAIAAFPREDPEAAESSGFDIFATDGNRLLSLSGGNTDLPFPGGEGGDAAGPRGLLAVDWNSDYAVDLVAAGPGGVRIFRREPDGSLVDVSDQSGLDPQTRDQPATAAWTLDVELDGDLDVVVAWSEQDASVLQNNGDGTFTDTHPFEGIRAPAALTWSDLNSDGLPDISLIDAEGALHVLLNERSGRYTEAALPQGDGRFVGMTSGDISADGRMDLVLVRPDGGIVRLSQTAAPTGWRWDDVVQADELPEGLLQIFLADLDNNGGLDLIVSGGSQTRTWLVDSSGAFLLLEEGIEAGTLGLIDLNADGRLDLVGITASGGPVQALNRGTKPYHWQVLRPRGARSEGDGRINSFGIGGEMQLRSGLIVQQQVISGPSVHFGLGASPRADVVRIVWPNGTTQAEFDLEPDQIARAEQRLKGSCPFVFAFDGTAMRFVTDFLWRSPLGLRINSQDTAGVSQTQDWIRIDSSQLAPRDGHYEIRITAELWETHYFDHMALMVVDHPEDTEIFVDERFARTPPELKLHTTGRLYAVGARDDAGNDVSDVVRSPDGDYLDTFDRGWYQGVARDHWVEVEIPDDVPQESGMRLIARGWVHPTDSSINVALSQGRHDPPQALSLEVLGPEGEWSVARADLGFPAGKDKTIVIDLDGLFSAEKPRRFRLRTNLEVFWDRLAVAFAADEDTVQSHTLTPSSAVLRHRGYSLMTQANPASPELPDYNQLTGTAQRWNDLEGYYTRFGDVRDLLEQMDDRYVIANAGDEVVLRFAAPYGPPSGWSRDFVLMGAGWNKDGDYNTAFSRTVLPLPSHEWAAYDRPPGELVEDPVFRRHARDWQEFHTRYVTPTHFHRGLRPSGGSD